MSEWVFPDLVERDNSFRGLRYSTRDGCPGTRGQEVLECASQCELWLNAATGRSESQYQIQGETLAQFIHVASSALDDAYHAVPPEDHLWDVESREFKELVKEARKKRKSVLGAPLDEIRTTICADARRVHQAQKRSW